MSRLIISNSLSLKKTETEVIHLAILSDIQYGNIIQTAWNGTIRERILFAESVLFCMENAVKIIMKEGLFEN